MTDENAAKVMRRAAKKPLLVITAVAVSVAVGAGGALLFNGDGENSAPSPTSVPSKGVITGETTTSTTALETFTAVPDPDAPPDIDLTGSGTTVAEPPGEPFIAEALPAGTALTVASFTPTSGTSGTTVRIAGTALDRVTAVSFNGVAVDSFTALSSTELMTSVPMGATSGQIRLTTDGGESVSTAAFTITSASVTGVTTQAGLASPTSGAVRLDGATGTAINAGASRDWAIGTGDFTVEWFQYQTPGSSCCPRAFSLGVYPNAELAVETQMGVVRVWVDGGLRISHTPPPSPGYFYRWVHVAVTRSAGTLYLYIDGVRRESVANTSDIQPGTLPLVIGAEPNNLSPFPGHMTNFHFVNGTALYTDTTLPVPTGDLAPVANTKLLLKFASSATLLADSSPGTPKTVTAVGGVTFADGGTSPTFGSARFDGANGSFLLVPGHPDWSLGTGDFTIEWFQYQTSGPDPYSRIFSIGSYPWANVGVSVESGGVVYVWIAGGNRIRYVLGAGYLNNWVHVALTRSAGVAHLYVNGVRVGSAWAGWDLQTAAYPLAIGAETGSAEFQGYLSNFHWVKGTALYSGPTSTVPTGPITPVANTKLLLRFASPANFLADSSPGTPKVVTVNGGVTPALQAAVGSTVTISGANFAGATSVSFGGVETPPLSVSATSITARVPKGAVTGPVTVRTSGGATTSSTELTITTPVISSVSPTSAAPGTVVTITGANFRGATSVTFGGVAASFQIVSPTKITATVPGGALTGPTLVATPVSTATSEGTFVVAPRLTSFNVGAQVPGEVVLINGVNLADTTAVTFTSSEQLAAFTVVSPTQLRVVVPDDAVTGSVTVTNSGGSAVSGSFTISPKIAELVPASGPAGTVVTIRGSGLRGTTSVRYGATGVTFVQVSPQEITFTVPAGATTSAAVVVGSVTGPTFTLAASPDVVLAGSAAAATVTAATAAGGSTSVATALVGATSVALGGGLRFDLSASALVGSQMQGTGTLVLGSLVVPATIAYNGPGDWTITAAAGSGTMRIGSTTIATDRWSGTVVASAGTSSWTLQGRVSLNQPSVIASKVKIVGGTVRPVPTCPDHATSSMCASAPTAYVRIEAPSTVTETLSGAWTVNALGLEVNLGNGMPSMSPGNSTLIPFRAVLNPVSGAVVLNATFDKEATAQLGSTRAALMRSMTLTMANGDPVARLGGDTAVKATGTLGGFDVLVSGRGHVGITGIGTWNATNVASVFTDAGVAVTGDVSGGARVAELAMSSFAYVRMQTAVTIGATVVQVPANSFVLTGAINAPAFLKQLGIDGAVLAGYAVYTENSGVIKLYATLPVGLRLPSIPGISVSIDSATFVLEIPIDKALANFVATISGQGTITPQGRNPVAMTLQASYDFAESSITIALSATSPTGAAVWPNVFGVSGFDMNSFAVQIGVTKAFPYVSVGLMGTGTVPQKLREYMGLDTSRTVPTSFTANLSVTSPCLEVSIGTPNSTDAIIGLPPGMKVITASYATIQASQKGCRVGTIAAVSEVAPGVLVAAEGTLLGSPVSFFAKYDPTLVGPSPGTPTYLGWTDVKMANLPGLAFDANYRFSIAAGGWTLFPKSQIRGGIAFGSNARIALSGSCEVRASGPRCDQSGSGAISIAGFKLNMDISVEGWGSPNVVYSGSASVRVGGVRTTLAGTFGTAGVLQSSTMDNPGLIYSFSAAGRFPGSIIDTFEISIVKTPGTTVLPSGTFRASGNVGGVFAQSSGSTRWTGSTTFNPSMANVTIPADFVIPLGAVNVPVKLKLRLCLTGSCAGTVVPTVDVGFTFLRQRIDISDIAVDATTWGFSYRLQRSISKSGQAGSSWGGIKGTVTSSIDFSISDTNVSLRSVSASAKAYIGVGGSWNYVGTVGVEFRSSGEYCFSASGKRLCV